MIASFIFSPKDLADIIGSIFIVVVSMLFGAAIGFAFGSAAPSRFKWVLKIIGHNSWYNDILVKAIRFCRRPFIWLQYWTDTNAVVASDISDCAPYLDAYFRDGGEGELWMLNSDLEAFEDSNTFDRLYLKVVGKRANVKRVLMILDKVRIDLLSPAKWKKIRRNLSGEGEKVLNKLSFCFAQELRQLNQDDRSDDCRKLRDYLGNYLGNDTFIFYVRGSSIQSSEAICVHRRCAFDDDFGKLEDYRITLTATRNKMRSRRKLAEENTLNKARKADPLHLFVPDNIRSLIDALFDDVDWMPFRKLLESDHLSNT